MKSRHESGLGGAPGPARLSRVPVSRAGTDRRHLHRNLNRDAPTAELVGQLQLLADITASRVAELQSREADTAAAARAAPVIAPPSDPRMVLTRAELRRREKQNIEAALAETGGKVFGTSGAAALLGMRPTTLASRIKALKIR